MQRLLKIAAQVKTVLAVIYITAFAFEAQAGTTIMSAPDAANKIANGEIIVLDIRSPEEWKESGLAKGAWPESMHVQGFPTRLQNIFRIYGPKNVALICATGGRTDYVVKVLERNGIHGVADISEAMFGNGKDPGWVARGLPVVSMTEAMQDYEKAQRSWEGQ
ncbi:MAG: rhodanese-like domain-containing protein [Planktomarina sp.]